MAAARYLAQISELTKAAAMTPPTANPPLPAARSRLPATAATNSDINTIRVLRADMLL
jgi:hypothetical protein